MKFLNTFILLFIVSIGYGQTIEKQINSLEFNKNRSLKIHLPKGYKNDTIKKFPLVIVLDNGYLFDLFVGNSTVFAEADLAPQQIVVGLDTDYARNQDVSTVTKNGDLTKNGRKFYNYIKKEVIPYLEANLKASPFLTIAGQGKAGNFITHFLKEQKPIFNAYLAISPTFNESTPNLFSTYNLKRLDDIDNQFYLYVSNNNSSSKQEKDIGALLKEGIEGLALEKLHVKFDVFTDSQNLPTAISASIPYAFTHIFDLYGAISKKEFEEKIKELAPLEAIKYLEDKYIDTEYLFGTNMNVRLEDIYAIEGIVMDRQDGDYLRVLGDFAMIKHPHSPLGDYYVGMFHELGKDYEKADFYYKSGYGKMDPSDPNADAFYQNIERVAKLAAAQPKDEEIPLDDEPLDEENPDEETPEEDAPEDDDNGDDE